MEFPQSVQAEKAINSMMMYLYQAYTEEQSIPSEKAKEMVVKKILEEADKFKGNNVTREKTASTDNNFIIKTINNSLESLKQCCKDKHSRYFLDTVKFNIDKLIENNNLS